MICQWILCLSSKDEMPGFPMIVVTYIYYSRAKAWFCISREFSRYGVDLLYKRGNSGFLAKSTNRQLCRANASTELSVRKTILFRLSEQIDWNVGNIRCSKTRWPLAETTLAENQAVDVRERLLESEDVVQFVQEPFVNVGHLPDFINAVSSMKNCWNSEDMFVR